MDSYKSGLGVSMSDFSSSVHSRYDKQRVAILGQLRSQTSHLQSEAVPYRLGVHARDQVVIRHWVSMPTTDYQE